MSQETTPHAEDSEEALDGISRALLLQGFHELVGRLSRRAYAG